VKITVDRQGTLRTIYSEGLDLSQLGKVLIKRASQVEPDTCGLWWADMALSGGPNFGPFVRRSEAIAVEVAWLENHSL